MGAGCLARTRAADSVTPTSRKRYASERRMERERDMRAKEAKTGVAHEASSRREGGTVRPDRRERVRKSASASGPNAPKVEIMSILGDGDKRLPPLME